MSIRKQIELLKDFANEESYGISREILLGMIYELEKSSYLIECKNRALHVTLLLLDSINRLNKMLSGDKVQ
jgi:hypothetical protein